MSIIPGEGIGPSGLNIPSIGVVSVEELLAYMGDLQVTPNQEFDAEALISGVQGELELWLNRPLSPVHVRETVYADGTGYINFTITPIHKLVKVDRFTGTDTGTEEVEITQIAVEDMSDIVDENGLPYRTLDKAPQQTVNSFLGYGGASPFGYGWYLVEYIGGYIGYWDWALKQSVLRVCAREFEDNADDAKTIQGDGNLGEAEKSDPRPKGWTDEELKALDRLRRRVVV